MTDQDVLALALHRLRGLKVALDADGTRRDVEERFALEYDSVLSSLEVAGHTVDALRLGIGDVGPILASAVPAEDEYHYSQERYVQRTLLLSKVTAALGYFTWKTERPPETLGYDGPGR
jgi:hypothetical protein